MIFAWFSGYKNRKDCPMKTYFFPLLLFICISFSSCTYLINTAIYGTNCETCRVLDYWDEVQWCDEECYGEQAKCEMREACETYASDNGGWCSCVMGEEDDLD